MPWLDALLMSFVTFIIYKDIFQARSDETFLNFELSGCQIILVTKASVRSCSDYYYYIGNHPKS